MTQAEATARGPRGSLARVSDTVPNFALRFIGLAVLDAFALWLVYQLVQDGIWPLAAVIAFVTVLVNVFNFRQDLAPLRWQAPALSIIILLLLYPILFTVYAAFTNYSDGHILSKTQAIRRLGQEQYLPEGAPTYRWTAFRSPEGEYTLWLSGQDGETWLARPGEPLQDVTSGEEGVGSLDENDIPKSIEGYRQLERTQVLRYLPELDGLKFGIPPNTVQIRSLDKAAQYQQRYVYNEAQDAILDQQTDKLYHANEKIGFFTSSEGDVLVPGYQVTIGLRNFRRLLGSPAFRGPFVKIFLWTVAFAFFSVFTTFALGLLLAMAFNDPILPGRKLIRSLLIMPYTLPGVLGVLIWRGLLNPHLGVVSTSLQSFVGWAPPFLTSPWWSKIGILLVNLWLGYPYMMLICSGALQAIPTDIYEAAQVDGASSLQSFWNITLPLLLVNVGPLLIASFVFNFNNFTIIYAYNEGKPPMAGTPTPAGHTDILITYTYRIAFEGGRGSDYAYASAITIVIFLIVAAITLYQYRFTGRWEEISENV